MTKTCLITDAPISFILTLAFSSSNYCMVCSTYFSRLQEFWSDEPWLAAPAHSNTLYNI